MTTNQKKATAHLTMIAATSIIALKTKPGTKTNMFFTDLAAVFIVQGIKRAAKARWAK